LSAYNSGGSNKKQETVGVIFNSALLILHSAFSAWADQQGLKQ